jgi:hypothetical protein
VPKEKVDRLVKSESLSQASKAKPTNAASVGSKENAVPTRDSNATATHPTKSTIPKSTLVETSKILNAVKPSSTSQDLPSTAPQPKDAPKPKAVFADDSLLLLSSQLAQMQYLKAQTQASFERQRENTKVHRGLT